MRTWPQKLPVVSIRYCWLAQDKAPYLDIKSAVTPDADRGPNKGL